MESSSKNTRYLFIYNPNSGTSTYDFLTEFDKLKHRFVHAKVMATAYPGHAIKIVNEYQNQFDCIVAVGGDGTVNEIANALHGSNKTMGIIPVGSGNGFARHLGITSKNAFTKLLQQNAQAIDMVKFNTKLFVNVAGLGFDGHISFLFNHATSRGLRTYTKLSIQEFIRFKPFPFQLKTDNETINGNAFILAFANSSQYGNNFKIAPQASVLDGRFNIVVIKKPTLMSLPLLIWQIIRGLPLSPTYSTSITATKATVTSANQKAHIDGESYEYSTTTLQLEVLPKCLKVIL